MHLNSVVPGKRRLVSAISNVTKLFDIWSEEDLNDGVCQKNQQLPGLLYAYSAMDMGLLISLVSLNRCS